MIKLLIEGTVDITKEHFEITYGSVQDKEPKLINVSLLGKGPEGDFVYQFLPNVTDSIKKEVLHDFEFYLIEHGPQSVMKDAWEYAKYHATTSSNIYSPVHWNFHPLAVYIEDEKKAID
jgi:hypothetical protein